MLATERCPCLIFLAFLLRAKLSARFGPLPPYITFYPAVILSAVLWGFYPGLLATLLAALSVGYWILPPYGQWRIDSPSDQAALALFSGMGVFMSAVAGLYRRARDRVAQYERDQALRDAAQRSRKRTEEVLRRYELLAANSRDIVLFMQRDDGRILEANAAATKAYGFSHEELLALRVQELRAPGTREAASEQMSAADNQGILFETVHRRKDDSTFPVEVSSQGSTLDGTRTLISVVRDITERKQAEERLSAERDRLAVTLRSIGDAVIATDEQGHVELLNGVAEQLTGWKADDALGKSVHEIFTTISEESRQPVVNPVGPRTQRGRDPGARESHRSRGARWLRAPYRGQRSSDPRHGRPRHGRRPRVSRPDRRTQGRASVAGERSRMRQLAEALPQLVWTADETGHVDFFNERWRNYTGQLRGAEDWKPALHPDDCERVVALWNDAVAQQKEFEVEHRLRRADGEFRWFLRCAVLLSHADGVGVRWFGACTDIHDLKLSQDLLRQADRMKEDFISMAAHEFRTPLTALRLQTDLLERNLWSTVASDEKVKRQLSVMNVQIDRIDGLLGALLDVSRISAGRFALDLESVGFGPACP